MKKGRGTEKESRSSQGTEPQKKWWKLEFDGLSGLVLIGGVVMLLFGIYYTVSDSIAQGVTLANKYGGGGKPTGVSGGFMLGLGIALILFSLSMMVPTKERRKGPKK